MTSLRSVPVNPTTTEKLGAVPRSHSRDTALLRKSQSLETLARGAQIERDAESGAAGSVHSGMGRSQTKYGGGSDGNRLLSASRSSTAVRFCSQAGMLEAGEEQQGKNVEQGGGGEVVETTAPGATIASTRREKGCDEKVARKMRRGSEMATWATCGTGEKSARDYLW